MISKGPNGGVMMHLADEPEIQELVLKGSPSGVTYLGLPGAAATASGPFPRLPVEDDTDDVTDLIEQHREEFPISEHFATFDPPKHTEHRGLMMRLLTPRRLRENEEFMGRFSDQLLEGIVARGRADFVADYAAPENMLNGEIGRWWNSDRRGVVGATTQTMQSHPTRTETIEQISGRQVCDIAESVESESLEEIDQLWIAADGGDQHRDRIEVRGMSFQPEPLSF